VSFVAVVNERSKDNVGVGKGVDQQRYAGHLSGLYGKAGALITDFLT